MGYTYNPSTKTLEIYSLINSTLTITNAGVTAAVAALPATNWVGTPTYAFLDFIVPNWHDTSGGANYLDVGGSLQIQDSGSSWNDATLIGLGCYCGANEYQAGYAMFTGYVDLVSYIQNGTAMNLRIDSVIANANNLLLYTTLSKLRLYFDGS